MVLDDYDFVGMRRDLHNNYDDSPFRQMAESTHGRWHGPENTVAAGCPTNYVIILEGQEWHYVDCYETPFRVISGRR